MASVDELLVRRNEGLVLLLTPPFDHMVPSPGYIQGYVPGVRENGGQYTHAALWTVLAFAELGDGDRATRALRDAQSDQPRADTGGGRPLPRRALRRRRRCLFAAAPRRPRRLDLVYGIVGLDVSRRHGSDSGPHAQRATRCTSIPCIPRAWPRFEAVIRRPDAEWRIVVENPAAVNRGVQSIELDGADHTGRDIPLGGITGVHAVRVVLG